MGHEIPLPFPCTGDITGDLLKLVHLRTPTSGTDIWRSPKDHSWQAGGMYPIGMLSCYRPEAHYLPATSLAEAGRWGLPPVGRGRWVLISSGDHRSTQYVSYLNEFLLSLDSTPGRMWDVFHPSQPMPGGFPLGVFFHPQKGSKLFHMEPSHKANWPGQNLFWVT